MLLAAGFYPEGIIVLGLHLENSVFSHLLITNPSEGNFSSLVLPHELLWQNFPTSECVDKHSMHVAVILQENVITLSSSKLFMHVQDQYGLHRGLLVIVLLLYQLRTYVLQTWGFWSCIIIRHNFYYKGSFEGNG